MSPVINFPIRAYTCDQEFLHHFKNEISHLQKLIYPQHRIKELPISPGGELTILNLVLSSLSYILDLLPKEPCDSLSIENDQFRLIFHRKQP